MSENIITNTFNKKISRRSFVKWTTAIGATTTLSGLVVSAASTAVVAANRAPASASLANGGSITDWVPSTCLVCHSWCRIAIGKDVNNIVRKIEGLGGQPRTNAFGLGLMAQQEASGSTTNNRYDDTYNRFCQTTAGQLSYSHHNRGRICAKGNDGMEHLYDPDRIKYPLIRVGKRGSGKWRKISYAQLYNGDPSISLDDGNGRFLPWLGIAKVLRGLGGSSPTLGAFKASQNYNDGSGQSYYDDIKPASGSAGTDRRHRFVVYIGRNESDQTGAKLNKMFGRFVDAYGTANRIEHTNLCEESRHAAQWLMMKEKFPMPNLFIHRVGAPTITAATDGRKKGDGKVEYTVSAKDDCDFYVSWGGNVTEASIPHTALAQRAADLKRNGGRIVAIDVRQSNTMAFADEQIKVNPGTDGALAAGIIHTIMANYNGTTTALKARLDTRAGTWASASGNIRYRGLFKAEEGTAWMPTGKSIESYVLNEAGASGWQAAYGGTNPDLLAAGSPRDAAWASVICGVSAGDIKYLAWAASNNFGNASGNTAGISGVDGVPASGSVPPRNPIFDGYRGPCKHSNGTYSYMLIRALQMIATGYDDGTGATATEPSENARRAGGVNRPGGLNHYSWDGKGSPFHSEGASPGHEWTGGTNGWTATHHGSWPTATASGTTVGKMRVDNWDYYGNGKDKWGFGKAGVYSMVVPGIRASLGLDPFKEGRALATANSNPYGKDYLGGTNPNGYAFDDNFQVEVVLNHKGNPIDNTPGPQIDRELFTSTGTRGYRLKYFFSCDINMGDGTAYADAIIPDSSYLERWVWNWHENPAHMFGNAIRQPYNQDSLGRNETLYGVRSVRQFLYELSRAIEGIAVDSNGFVGGANVPAAAGVAPWNRRLFKSFDFDFDGHGHADTSGTADTTGSGKDAERGWFKHGLSEEVSMPASVPGYYANGFTYMRVNGVLETLNTSTPNYWVDNYHSEGINSTPLAGDPMDNGSGAVSAVEAYHARLDAYPDPTTNETGKHADNTFFGSGFYDPIRRQGGKNTGATVDPVATPASGYYNMTTYKVNVHTQARTAACPRLMEIIGSNWAVMAPGSKDTAFNTIKNGDKVRIIAAHATGVDAKDNTLTRSIVCEAKISEKALNANVVSISQSMGHDIGSFGGDGYGGIGWQTQYPDGTWHNSREDRDPAVSLTANAALPSAPSTRYDATNNGPEPVAGAKYRGSEPAWAMTRGGEDPVGTSVAWFDTMVTVTIIS